MDKGRGRWAALVVASFLIHTALTVNSTETALWNEQGRVGVLLAQQLADAAAPLALAHDMVSLSVLASRYENRPGVSSVRLYNPRNEIIAETGDTVSGDRLFSARLQVQQQVLGRVDLRLATASRSDIVRFGMGNIGLSALLHALLFTAGLFVGRRREEKREPAPAPAGAPAATTPLPATHAAATADATLLHIAPDDPNGLLGLVSADMADELLSLFDQFADRIGQLYGGRVLAPFSSAGVQVSFSQAPVAEREFQALAAGRLFLQLVEDSMEERRRHGRLCLDCRIGVAHGDGDADLAALLARTAPAGRLLSGLPTQPLGGRCRFGTSFRLATDSEGITAVSVALVEGFAPEYQQLICNQSQQILGPVEA